MGASLLEALNELLIVGKVEPFELSEGSAKKLNGLLVPHFTKPELIEVVEDLARFAVWSGREAKSPAVEARLLAPLECTILAVRRLGHEEHSSGASAGIVEVPSSSPSRAHRRSCRAEGAVLVHSARSPDG